MGERSATHQSPVAADNAYIPATPPKHRYGMELSHGVAQRVDVADKQVAAPVGQIAREEVGATRDTVSAIVGHRMVFAVAVSLGKPVACGDG